jgi:NTP pyrophosphatase (non-canonical NTP hydrolase)
MDINDYQVEAAKTAIYPPGSFAYLALGLNGEAGEVAEIIKRTIRSGKALDENELSNLKKELGDCLWYIANLAREAGFNLSSIAQENVSKLQSRQARGALEGRGNDR